MPLNITLVQGGGAGYDQVPAVKRILEGAGVDIDWDEQFAGQAAVDKGLAPLPDTMLESVRRNRLALKTKLLLPATTLRNYNLEFRRLLGLFAAVRPVRNLRGLPARFQNVDILVIRELTEDLYAAIEHEIVPGVVQRLKVVTLTASKRFFRFAFEHARAAGRKKVHCVHKANILKMADGLFLEAFRETAKDFPEFETRELIVDNCAMQMVSKPHQFDVMVMGNLYGDIVSDLGAGIVGGISATFGINIGEGIRVYETFHGGRRDVVGVERANPLPLLLPAIALLNDNGQGDAARRIQSAVEQVLSEGKYLTPNLGGDATTAQMTEALIIAMNRGPIL